MQIAIRDGFQRFSSGAPEKSGWHQIWRYNFGDACQIRHNLDWDPIKQTEGAYSLLFVSILGVCVVKALSRRDLFPGWWRRHGHQRDPEFMDFRGKKHRQHVHRTAAWNVLPNWWKWEKTLPTSNVGNSCKMGRGRFPRTILLIYTDLTIFVPILTFMQQHRFRSHAVFLGRADIEWRWAMYQLATGYLGPAAYSMAKNIEQILETKPKTHGDFIDWL